VFLVGIPPALLVFWIRRAVPEPEEWHPAKTEAVAQPLVWDLFRGEVLPISIKTILVCSIDAHGLVGFPILEHSQPLRHLPELASWTVAQREQLVSKSFLSSSLQPFWEISLQVWLASLFSYRRAIAIMCLGFFISFMGAYAVPRD
jgi:hypothetical protein